MPLGLAPELELLQRWNQKEAWDAKYTQLSVWGTCEPLPRVSVSGRSFAHPWMMLLQEEQQPWMEGADKCLWLLLLLLLNRPGTPCTTVLTREPTWFSASHHIYSPNSTALATSEKADTFCLCHSGNVQVFIPFSILKEKEKWILGRLLW